MPVLNFLLFFKSENNAVKAVRLFLISALNNNSFILVFFCYVQLLTQVPVFILLPFYQGNIGRLDWCKLKDADITSYFVHIVFGTLLSLYICVL